MMSLRISSRKEEKIILIATILLKEKLSYWCAAFQ